MSSIPSVGSKSGVPKVDLLAPRGGVTGSGEMGLKSGVVSVDGSVIKI